MRVRWVAAALCAWCLLHAFPALAQNILIFRPAENNATEVETAEIELEVHIASFAPVRSVTINGFVMNVPSQTMVVIKQRYRLVPGENAFLVEATTENGTVSKEFVITLTGPGEAEPEKPHFQMIALLGSQTSSNANAAAADDSPLEGTRNFIVLVPRYDWFLADESTLRLQSIFSRDAYGDEALAAEEVAFTQLSFAWLLGDPAKTEWTFGVGYNYIDQGYDGLKGVSHIEDDWYLFTSFQQGLSKTGAWNIGLEIKQQDLVDEPTDPDENQDATVLTLKVAGNEAFFGMRSKGQVAYTSHDAVGKLHDQTVTRATFELAYPLGPFVPALGMRYKHTAYKEVDPDLGLALDKTLVTAAANVNYLITEGWVLILEYIDEEQSANEASEVYANQATSLTLVVIF